MNEKEKLARLRLARSASIGPIVFRNLIETYGSAEHAIEHVLHRVKRVGNKNLRIASEDSVLREWSRLRELGGEFLIFGSPEYPANLAAIPDPPPVLSYLGPNLHLFKSPQVAIVGSRHPSINSYEFTKALSFELSRSGIVTVSGLARGIDTACHIGSIDHQSGASIAVMANGIDICYPRQNQRLYDRLKSEGLILSECPIEAPPISNAFPRRNRIVSGLSLAVVVIEARLRSGSLITARHALEQGRDVLAVPSTPSDERARGCLELLKQGAQVCSMADDVLKAIEHVTIPFREDTSSFDHTDRSVAGVKEFLGDNNIHRELLTFLGPTPVEFSMICDHSKHPISLIRAALLDHEIAGNVTRASGDSYMLTLGSVNPTNDDLR